MVESLSVRKLRDFGMWLQYPLRALLPSIFGQIPEAPVPQLGGSTNATLPVSALPQHQALHVTFDMLIRLKELQLRRQTMRTKQEQLVRSYTAHITEPFV